MKKNILILCFFICFSFSLKAAEIKLPQIVLSSQQAYSPFIKQTNEECLKTINSLCFEFGRFYPVSVSTPDSENSDILLNLSLNNMGREYFCLIEIKALNKKYQSLSCKMRVKARDIDNLKLKIAEKICDWHKNIPLVATVKDASQRNYYYLSAGQWQGIVENEKLEDLENHSFRVISVSRYQSLIYCEEKLKIDQDLFIQKYPEVKKKKSFLQKELKKNTIKMYSLETKFSHLKNSEQLFIQDLLIVNMFGNLLLPGYAAYLSTGYLGMTDLQPDYLGISLTAVNVLLQFTLPTLMTGFKGNFCPWIQDEDKSIGLKNLHIFLWSTLPLTYTVAWLDQLVVQYKRAKVLPPFFENENLSAFLFSSFIPGGGLFFKGRRVEGWFYYYTEMFLVGGALLNWQNGQTGKIMLYTFLGVKAVELLHSILRQSSYSYYEEEKLNNLQTIYPILAIYNNDQETKFLIGASCKF